MASRAPLFSVALAFALCLTALPSPGLARLDLSRSSLPNPQQSGRSQLAAALSSTAELIHTEFSSDKRRSLALDTTCDVTNVRVMNRQLAQLPGTGVNQRILYELRFTNNCAYNLTNAVFSYCFNFADMHAQGIPNPLAAACYPGTGGLRATVATINGQPYQGVFCKLTLDQAPSCKVQLLPGQSVSFYYLDMQRFNLCTYDVTFDTPGPDTRSVDANLGSPKNCAPDTPAATCIPSSLKYTYCRPGDYQLYYPTCAQAKWC